MEVRRSEGSSVDELRGQIGIERHRLVSYPVSASDIRKFAIAVYWPEKPPRLYWDEEYAKTTRWGGIVAPSEFNPFAWPVEGLGRLPTPPSLPQLRPYNGGSEAEYFAPIRVGDVIIGVDRLVDVYERQGKAGRLLFLVTETRWTNQRGEPVKVHRGISVRLR